MRRITPVISNSLAMLIVLTCAAWAARAMSPRDPRGDNRQQYDFRTTQAYLQLTPQQRQGLEQVLRDFVLLWGALEIYADNHDGRPPEKLEDLTPLYLRELPKDPFATAETAAQKAEPYIASREGLGYRYRKGSEGNRAWILASVGLNGFPYLAEHDNVDLYICKGTWISGMNPQMTNR